MDDGLKVGRILLGAIIGVGAVAVAPFTGGGSVLGATTLSASLSGVGTGLASVVTGLVGAAIADGLADEAECNAYADGYEEAKSEYATEEQLAEESWGPLC